jgi:hypothetical protein
MRTRVNKPQHALLKDQAAKVLIAATYEFLRRNNVSRKTIKALGSVNHVGRKYQVHLRSYRKLMRSYEHMGALMATWFSNPRFLDKSGNPIALTISGGPRSIASLIRLSGVRIPKQMALELMRCSPSIRCTSHGGLLPLRRVFVLPEFELPRAALVVERYLDTLQTNTSRREQGATLLERSCHATGIDLRAATPVLRDIKERGAAFMDSIDGEIEACRSGRSKNLAGEVGVLVFAWTSPSTKVRGLQKL